MLPKIQGVFRLTREAELRYAQSGTSILSLGLASSEKYKDTETQCFLDATVFGKPAEIINQYAGNKGTQIFLSGKLKTEQWQNQQGENRSKLVMVVEDFVLLHQKNSNTQPAQQQPAVEYQNAQGQPITQQQSQQAMQQQQYQQPAQQQYQQQQPMQQARQMPPQQPPIEIDSSSEIPF